MHILNLSCKIVIHLYLWFNSVNSLILNPTIRELMELRQKGKKFEHVVNNPTQGDLVSLLGQSLVGSALTAIFVCVSQVSHT